MLGSVNPPVDALVPNASCSMLAFASARPRHRARARSRPRRWLAEQISALVASGRGLLAEDDAFAALSAWLHATLVHGLTYRGLSAAVMSSALDRDREVSRWHAELFEVAALVERARASGAVVADAYATDVLKLVGAIAWAAQDAPDGGAQADRLLGLVLRGLRRGVT
jgi:hypothetical protein